jgi:hypothetical protein
MEIYIRISKSKLEKQLLYITFLKAGKKAC